MKKILLLSDTHSFLDPKIIKYINDADEVWHAGDIGALDVCAQIESLKPLRAVHGNIDGTEIRKAYPEDLIFTMEDVKVFITHIGGYPGAYKPQIKAKIKEIKPALFICGHSHILKVMHDKEFDLLHMNPGAAGVHGFHQVKTLLRFTMDQGQIKDLDAIELGPRAEIKK